MKEPSDLDKLNAVATANASDLYPLRGVFTVLSASIVGIAAVASASPLENASVRIFAALLVATTASIYAGWRYARPVAYAFLYIGSPAFLLYDHRSRTSFGWLSSLIYFCAAVFGAIFVIRMFRAISLANSPACEVERQKIGRWKEQLASPCTPPNIIQFAAGDFWTDGRATVRLFRQDNWIVTAYFRRQDIAKAPTITVFDAQLEPVLYSPEQRRLRIGKRRFRKVEFTPESVAPAHQLAQIVASV